MKKLLVSLLFTSSLVAAPKITFEIFPHQYNWDANAFMRIGKSFSSQASFIESPYYAKQWQKKGVTHFPTILVYHDGVEIARRHFPFYDHISAEEIKMKNFINDHIINAERYAYGPYYEELFGEIDSKIQGRDAIIGYFNPQLEEANVFLESFIQIAKEYNKAVPFFLLNINNIDESLPQQIKNKSAIVFYKNGKPWFYVLEPLNNIDVINKIIREHFVFL